MTDYNATIVDGQSNTFELCSLGTNSVLSIGAPPGSNGNFTRERGVNNDGSRAYLLVPVDLDHYKLVSYSYKGGVYPQYVTLLGGATIANDTHGGQDVSFAFDGTYIYFITPSTLYIYDPLTDSIVFTYANFDASGNGNMTLVWDGIRTVYGIPTADQYAPNANYYSRIDTASRVVTTGLSLTQFGGVGGDYAAAVFCLNAQVYRVSYAAGNLRLGVCTEGASPGFGLSFGYSASVASLIGNPNVARSVGYLYSPTQIYLLDGVGVAQFLTFDPTANTITGSSATQPAPGQSSNVMCCYPFTPSARLYQSDKLTPVVNYALLNTTPTSSGFPSLSSLFYVQSLINATHLYVSPVVGVSAIAPYIQVAPTNTGPWSSLVDLGPTLAGFQYPLYVRAFPPAGFVSLASVPFSVRIIAA